MKTVPLKLFLSGMIALSTFISCSKDEAYYPPTPKGFMVHVNAFAGEHPLSFLIDKRGINNNMPPVAFKSFAAANMFTGQRNYKILSQSLNKTLIDSTITVKDATSYMSFVFGTTEKPVLGISIDSTIPDLGENAAFRYYNLANGVTETNLYIGKTEKVMFSNRPTETGASIVRNQNFKPSESGLQTLVVRDNAGNLLARRSYNFTKERHYTIVLNGEKDNDLLPLHIGVVAVAQ